MLDIMSLIRRETAEWTRVGYLQGEKREERLNDVTPAAWRIVEAPGDLDARAGLCVTAPAGLGELGKPPPFRAT